MSSIPAGLKSVWYLELLANQESMRKIVTFAIICILLIEILIVIDLVIDIMIEEYIFALVNS